MPLRRQCLNGSSLELCAMFVVLWSCLIVHVYLIICMGRWGGRLAGVSMRCDQPRSVVPHACSLLTGAPPLRPFLAYIVSFPCAACCHHCFLLFTAVSLRRWRASVFLVLTFRCLSIFFHRISWMHYSTVYWREAIDPVTLDFPNKSCNHLISIGDLLKACLSLLTCMKG